jgi:integrase
VRRQWTKHGELTPPKTKKGVRRVPLTVAFARDLKRLKIASPFSQEQDPVFASQTGGYLGHRNVQRRAWEPVAEEAGLDLTFHQIRHGFASRAAHLGVPVGTLSEIMGHSDIGVTQRIYVHLYGREEAEDAFRKTMAAAR